MASANDFSYLALAIAGEALYDCYKIDSLGYTNLYVGVNIVQSLANFLLMLIMLLPLTLTLLRHNCFAVILPKVLNSVFLGILFIFCIIAIAIVSSNAVNLQIDDGSMYINFVRPVAALYAALYLLGALIAMGYVLVSLRPMLRYPTEFNGVGPAHTKLVVLC